MTPAMPTLLGETELVYDVKWPLGLVITSESLDHYKHMHRFLLHVRLTSLEMREAWALLRAIRRRGDLPPVLERLCGNVVYKMQALLQAFNETFATKVRAILTIDGPVQSKVITICIISGPNVGMVGA